MTGPGGPRDGFPGIDNLRELRLRAVLSDLVNAHGPGKLAERLGVDRRPCGVGIGGAAAAALGRRPGAHAAGTGGGGDGGDWARVNALEGPNAGQWENGLAKGTGVTFVERKVLTGSGFLMPGQAGVASRPRLGGMLDGSFAPEGFPCRRGETGSNRRCPQSMPRQSAEPGSRQPGGGGA